MNDGPNNNRQSPTRHSPSRYSKAELATALEDQIASMHRRRREQPTFVAGKIGMAGEREPRKPLPPHQPLQHLSEHSAHAHAANSSEMNTNRGFNGNDSSKGAHQRQLAAELDRQIAEREFARKLQYDRERQMSRDRLGNSSPVVRRGGRAFVPPPGEQHFDHSAPPPSLSPIPPAQPLRYSAEPDISADVGMPIDGLSYSPTAGGGSPKYGRRSSVGL
jgi:hypothetical protein